MHGNDNDAVRGIRSFVVRKGRVSPAQTRALNQYWSRYGLTENFKTDPARVFGRRAPLELEIGFGNGERLLRQALDEPHKDFIGVEVWPPGVGTLLRRLAEHRADNVRIVKADAGEYIKRCLPKACLDGVWILFPDPWPKKRHHKRRLVKGDFLELVAEKMKPGAKMYLATDWQHYADEMRAAVSASAQFEIVEDSENASENEIGNGARPHKTRFEQRGLVAGRAISNLVLSRRA